MTFYSGEIFSSENYIPTVLQEIILEYIDTRKCGICGIIVSANFDTIFKFKCEDCYVGLYLNRMRGWRCINSEYKRRSFSDSEILQRFPDILSERKMCNKKIKYGRRKCNCFIEKKKKKEKRYILNNVLYKSKYHF